MSELKSCPFCGSNAIWIKTETIAKPGYSLDRGYIGCVMCGCRTEGREAYHVAIDSWNRRKGSVS